MTRLSILRSHCNNSLKTREKKESVNKSLNVQRHCYQTISLKPIYLILHLYVITNELSKSSSLKKNNIDVFNVTPREEIGRE